MTILHLDPLPIPAGSIPETPFDADYAPRNWQFCGLIEGIGPPVTAAAAKLGLGVQQKIADAPEATRHLSFKSQEYVSG